MIKAIFILGLLFAVPAASETVRPPDKRELIQLRETVKTLQGLVAEQQDRLVSHKIENDSLKKRISILESRMMALEETRAITSLR